MQHNGNVEKFKKVKKFDFDEYSDRIQTKKKKTSKRIKRSEYDSLSYND